jgi:hypothetical protein
MRLRYIIIHLPLLFLKHAIIQPKCIFNIGNDKRLFDW